ncbi:MAG: sigma-70 family RNA polymerase sigma factor [Nitrospirota bacterium]|nr:sigma-70 family RNA polymerase sigma factor [Nitrospirota bacterium]
MTETKGIQEDDDQELVALCRKGNTDAFEILVRTYQKKMFNIAFRITGSMEDASEVVQDAFFAAHKNLKNFEQKSRFSTWLYSITVNTAKNRLKQGLARKTHEPHSSDDPLYADSSAKRMEPASDDPSALDLLLKKDRQKSVQECLNRLEQDFREVIVLRDIQGFAYAEIADMLSLAEGTVKSRLFRARDAIKDCLKKLLGDW